MNTTANRITILSALEAKKVILVDQNAKAEREFDKKYAEYKTKCLAKMTDVMTKLRSAKNHTEISDALNGDNYVRMPSLPNSFRSVSTSDIDRAIAQLKLSTETAIKLSDKNDAWILQLLA